VGLPGLWSSRIKLTKPFAGRVYTRKIESESLTEIIETPSSDEDEDIAQANQKKKLDKFPFKLSFFVFSVLTNF
jgi:hypothetical protein